MACEPRDETVECACASECGDKQHGAAKVAEIDARIQGLPDKAKLLQLSLDEQLIAYNRSALS